MTGERGRPAALLLLALAGSLAGIMAGPLTAQGAREARAELALRATPSKAWAGQVLTIEFVVEHDRAFFRDFALQLHRRALGVPLEIDAPWLAGFDGARRLADAAPRGADTRTLSLGGVETLARVDADGRLRVATRFAVDVPGRFALAAPSLRYAYATRFEEDFLGDRKPVDRQIAVVPGKALELVVDPLPRAGRPADFGGAVGRFALRAEARALGDDVHEVELVLESVGDHGADLSRVEPPRLAGGKGVHVRGQRVLRDGARVRSVSEVAVTDPDDAWLPAARFSFFDPIAERYESVASEDFVFAGPGRPAATERDPKDSASAGATRKKSAADKAATTDELAARPELASVEEMLMGAPASPAPTTLLAFALGILLAVPSLAAGFVWLRGWRRARARRRASDPASYAARVLRLESGDARDVEGPFGAYLARRLDAPTPEAWRSDLAEALVARGVAHAPAREAQRCMHALSRERYGQREGRGRGRDLVEHVRRVVRELEAERCA